MKGLDLEEDFPLPPLHEAGSLFRPHLPSSSWQLPLLALSLFSLIQLAALPHHPTVIPPITHGPALKDADMFKQPHTRKEYLVGKSPELCRQSDMQKA